jgi:hypothetical protein
VNKKRLAQRRSQPVEVLLFRVLDPEADLTHRWSFVQSKQQQRWLWQAVDHATGEVLAYVLNTHEDRAFLELKALLQPNGFSISIQMVGGRMNGILMRNNTPLVNVIPKRLSGNI